LVKIAHSPDEWIDREAQHGARAVLEHQSSINTNLPDRMTAGMTGGGGRWQLGLIHSGRMDTWESRWGIGDQEDPEQRIWKVRYDLTSENAQIPPSTPRSADDLVEPLYNALSDILAFSQRDSLRGFAEMFENALKCLGSKNPFTLVHHSDLVPPSLLSLTAEQLLATCQTAWVFGGMGSWNDLGFEGEEQLRYTKLSDTLFDLVNEAIVASVNSVRE
jgi:hypothetical protein